MEFCTKGTPCDIEGEEEVTADSSNRNSSVTPFKCSSKPGCSFSFGGEIVPHNWHLFGDAAFGHSDDIVPPGAYCVDNYSNNGNLWICRARNSA